MFYLPCVDLEIPVRPSLNPLLLSHIVEHAHEIIHDEKRKYLLFAVIFQLFTTNTDSNLYTNVMSIYIYISMIATFSSIAVNIFNGLFFPKTY